LYNSIDKYVKTKEEKMGNRENGLTTSIKQLDPELHLAIKVEAFKRKVNVNDLYKKIIASGAKRLGIVVNKTDGDI
jgi:hypothetical protein